MQSKEAEKHDVKEGWKPAGPTTEDARTVEKKSLDTTELEPPAGYSQPKITEPVRRRYEDDIVPPARR